MLNKKIIQQGAEAKIILSDDLIIKDRIPKSYRLKELDEKIRKSRTKSETKLLEKASNIINAPNPLPSKEFNKIKMPFIDGKKLSDYLDSFPLKKQKQICKQIGRSIAKLHNEDIIHGDLTTSNMILVENARPLGLGERRSSKSEPIVFFIDFGLGFISKKFEDKAVDVHLLRQAFEAKHFKHWKELFDEMIKSYKKSKDSKIVLERFKAVEKRGRYKH